jgi:hypothetical protein
MLAEGGSKNRKPCRLAKTRLRTAANTWLQHKTAQMVCLAAAAWPSCHKLRNVQRHKLRNVQRHTAKTAYQLLLLVQHSTQAQL